MEWRETSDAQLSEQERRYKEDFAEQERRYKEDLAEQERRYREDLAEQERRYKDALSEHDRHHQEAISAQEHRHQEAIQSQQQRFDDTMVRIQAQLKSATDDMLRQRQREFAETSNENLGQIVTPLRETIDKMKQAIDDSTLKQTAMSSELKVNIEAMIRQSEAARQSADELARAFKHGSKIQGDWGEQVLSEMLQSQGLTQGVHFDVQTYIRDSQGNIVTDDQGAMMRPDVILHLDQRREVIIDSKVSMTAYMDYVNADSEEERNRCLKQHLESLRTHVKELSSKDYSAYIQPPKVRMDYVIMFVPHSGALLTALNAQPDLWRRAMNRNVFIADEQTLFAALRIISLTWTQIAQAQNHEKVYALAAEMLDRVGLFMKRYQSIGKALELAQKAYDDAEKKLQPTGPSILQTSAKLIKLGAKQSEKNPLPQLLDIEDIPALDTDYASNDNDIRTDS
ncbi:MAG: DNA recombination protein RmuC [Prevotella sp.]|nr:DNA recombination protein RmuC [Prevotella sp.]